MVSKHFKKLDGDLLLTTVCPVECDFCIYSCSLKGEYMPEPTIRKVAEEYTKNNVGIRISGGEPFYNLDKLKKCLDIVLKYQKAHEILLITSGFFGNNKERTKKAFEILTKRKLDTLVVSVDRFHIPKVPLSNITQIINKAKKFNLKIILRVTTDEDQKSYQLMDKLAEIIVKKNIKFEPHHDYAAYGKAELLDSRLRINSKIREKYFNQKIMDFALKYKKPAEAKFYLEQSPKRSQRKFAANFFPTTFPNGNIYADSQCCKGSFMGNINKKTLKSLMRKFSKTLPGHILWSEKSACPNRMPRLLPANIDDYCDYCRDHPLIEEMPEEAIGRQFIIINIEDDFATLIKKVENASRELLLCFDLKESQLNSSTGNKIEKFLCKLKEKNMRFKISRPLPRCLFGVKYNEIIKRFNIPKNCYECSELFSVVDGRIVSCKKLNKKGPRIQHMENRNKIYEFFNVIRLTKAPSLTCAKCKYRYRGMCDGLCFRV